MHEHIANQGKPPAGLSESSDENLPVLDGDGDAVVVAAVREARQLGLRRVRLSAQHTTYNHIRNRFEARLQ